jgi:hypothetical protein
MGWPCISRSGSQKQGSLATDRAEHSNITPLVVVVFVVAVLLFFNFMMRCGGMGWLQDL